MPYISRKTHPNPCTQGQNSSKNLSGRQAGFVLPPHSLYHNWRRINAWHLLPPASRKTHDEAGENGFSYSVQNPVKLFQLESHYLSFYCKLTVAVPGEYMPVASLAGRSTLALSTHGSPWSAVENTAHDRT